MTHTQLSHEEYVAAADMLEELFPPVIDDVVIFNPLGQEEIFKIIEISLRDLLKRLKNLNFTLTLTDEAKKFVAEKGFDPQFGARPLHRAIQKYIEDPLAEFILNENPSEGSALEAMMNEPKDGVVVSYAKEPVKE